MDKPISFCVQINSFEKASLTEDERTSLLALGIFNCFLALPTTALNALIIISVVSTPELATPSYLLIMNLAFTDLLIGALGQPLHGAMILFYRNKNLETYCYIRSVSSMVASTAGAVSIGTVTAIAFDRYMAIRLKMRYRSVVSVTRVKFVLLLLWVTSILMASMPYYVSIFPVSILSTLLIICCLITIVTSYVLSFRALKKHCAQVQQQHGDPTQSNPAIDVEKYSELLKTMLIILVFIIVCYSIMAAVIGLLSERQPQRSVLWGLMSIVGVNSTFNPVIYLLRMRDLKHACKEILRKYSSGRRRLSSVRSRSIRERCEPKLMITEC